MAFESRSTPGPILVAGLSPAWQKTLFFENFRIGKVNRAREAIWSSSGKVLNAAVAVAELGEPCVTLAPLGGPGLVEIDREFQNRGIDHRWVRTETPTRVCTTIIEEDAGRMTEAVEEGTPLTDSELAEFERAFREESERASATILIGSLPKGTPHTFYHRLTAQAKSPLILDFRGPGLIQALAARPFLVKPNREELEQTVGRPLSTRDEVLSAMREINAAGARWVVITDGGTPILATSRDAVLEVDPLPVERPVNPLGCGDAMAAAFAVGVRRGMEFDAALRLATAAAAVNLEQRLPCRPLDRARIERLAAKR